MTSAWTSEEEWLAGGQRAQLPKLGRSVFYRLDGPEGAPALTLLHGFPTSSHDWCLVLGALAEGRRLLSFDFLGFGDSDKPHSHRYSIVEQADLVEELWKHCQVDPGGALVAHDYGVSVAQELLARGIRPERVGWLNGGVYPELHRATEGQLLLAGPDGEALARSLTPEVLAVALRELLGRPIGDEVAADLGAAAARREGLQNMHRLLGYIQERRANEERWVGALESASCPLRFVWGMLDPVSGEHMLARVRERLPSAELVELEDVGHYPQLEAPEEVAAALGAFLDGR